MLIMLIDCLQLEENKTCLESWCSKTALSYTKPNPKPKLPLLPCKHWYSYRICKSSCFCACWGEREARAMLLLLPGGSGGLHATGRSRGFGILGRSRRLGRSRGRGGRLGSGNYNGNRGRHDPLGWGCWFDVRNPVAVFVHADDDVHRLAAVLVLDPSWCICRSPPGTRLW